MVITAEISSDAISPYSLASHAIRAKCNTIGTGGLMPPKCDEAAEQIVYAARRRPRSAVHRSSRKRGNDSRPSGFKNS
jgi:hypothetical protein